MSVIYDQRADQKMYDVFSVRHEAPSDHVYSGTPHQWLHEDERHSFFDLYGNSISAPEDDMIVTFWANRYSRYIAFVHWALAKGYQFDPSINGVQVFLVEKPGIGELIFEFSVPSLSREISYTRKDRQNVLRQFYELHVTPLFHTFSAHSGIRSKEVWGQLYHALPYFIGLAKVTETANIRSIMEEDWELITSSTEAEVFGEKRTPFSFRCLEIPNPAEDKPLYTKPTCCLAYKSSDKYCYRCPRMKPEVRNEYYTKLKQNKS
ncbi:hypothetical protein [Alteribacillus sp. HJP-4]|uniref:hypothetical protein n=1 Tax=Alteribacillus sp. HJP-4 TaxID=2775394 RepID=UPI0035CD1EE7